VKLLANGTDITKTKAMAKNRNTAMASYSGLLNSKKRKQ
jgi:hypothetical protein